MNRKAGHLRQFSKNCIMKAKSAGDIRPLRSSPRVLTKSANRRPILMRINSPSPRPSFQHPHDFTRNLLTSGHLLEGQERYLSKSRNERPIVWDRVCNLVGVSRNALSGVVVVSFQNPLFSGGRTRCFVWGRGELEASLQICRETMFCGGRKWGRALREFKLRRVHAIVGSF